MRARTGFAPVALVLLARVAAALPLGHWTVGGWIEGYGVLPTVDSQRQRPAGILDLNVSGDLSPRARLFLDMRAMAGGPPEHAHGFGAMNLSDTFQDVSPSLEFEEGYLDLFLPSLDVRVGKQKFAWGKLDTFQPTDVINPRRYTDPFITEEQDAKIGVPALRASWYPPTLPARLPTDTSVTLVWVPVPVPARFPTADERWFPASVNLAGALRVPGRTFGPAFAALPDLVVRTSLETENVTPPQQLDEGAVGLRLAGLWGRSDWALYYYDGPETAPSFAFDTTVVAPDPMRFAGCLRRLTRGPCRLDATAVLHPIHGRIRMAGADAAVELAGVTARVEGAWFENRLLPRTVQDLISPANLADAVRPELAAIIRRLVAGRHVPVDLGALYVARDAVEWGAGLDYRVRGWTPVLQVNQTLVLNNPTTLLINDVDTRLFFVVRKAFFGDRFGTETGVVQNLERGYTAGLTRLTYAVTDTLRVRAGYLLLAGTRRSLIGQFHDNDEAFLQIRWSF